MSSQLPRAQIGKFRDAARELEADDEAKFDERMKNLAKAPKQVPPKQTPK